MDFRFVSNRPWVDETLRLRKALCFTTLAMAILGIILVILGIVLLAYMEFVVGVVSIIFGILLPVGYFGANVLLFARRRKSYDPNMVIEYHFTEDALEIIKLSDNFKAKSVVAYGSFNVNKVFNKSRFVVLKTKSYYSDIIIIRKRDIVLENGQELNQAIVNFVSFLTAKVAEANRSTEVTCQDEKEADLPISGQNNENTSENDVMESTNIDQDVNTSSDAVQVEDLTESDDVVDIEDEPSETESEPTNVQYDIIEEDETTDDSAEDSTTIEIGDSDDVEDSGETIEVGEDSLFDYSNNVVKNEDLVSNEPKTGFFYDYSSGEDEKKED